MQRGIALQLGGSSSGTPALQSNTMRPSVQTLPSMRTIAAPPSRLVRHTNPRRHVMKSARVSATLTELVPVPPSQPRCVDACNASTSSATTPSSPGVPVRVPGVVRAGDRTRPRASVAKAKLCVLPTSSDEPNSCLEGPHVSARVFQMDSEDERAEPTPGAGRCSSLVRGYQSLEATEFHSMDVTDEDFKPVMTHTHPTLNLVARPAVGQIIKARSFHRPLSISSARSEFGPRRNPEYLWTHLSQTTPLSAPGPSENACLSAMEMDLGFAATTNTPRTPRGTSSASFRTKKTATGLLPTLAEPVKCAGNAAWIVQMSQVITQRQTPGAALT